MNIIENHPNILLHNEIQSICKPLNRLNISYFCHVNINFKNEFSAIANNPEYHRYYLQNKHYNSDIHMANDELIHRYFIWDLVDTAGKSHEENVMAREFGVRHIFTVVDRNPNGKNYYHFATHVEDPAINHVYLNKMQMLESFILHFNSLVSDSHEIAKAYNIKFHLESEGKFEYSCGQKKILESDHEFYKELLSHSVASKRLTKQQLDILYWLHNGKTINEIASIMGLADVTVNKHIGNIKNKLDCYTQFQLGEVYSHLHYR